MATEKLKFLVTADTKGFALGMKTVAALATAAFAAAIKVSADYEKSLSKLRAISGANVKQMKSLEKQSRELGKTTAFTATEVAKLQVELAKLGFTSNDILNSSGGVLDLAAGLGVELADAAVLAGSTIRAFGLETEDIGRVVDVLAKSASGSALDFSKLTESLKLAAPIAKLYNFTIEDTVGLLGQLANAGIHGSQAGTALRQMFLELDKKGIAFADALRMVNESATPASTALNLVGKRAAGAFAIIAQNQGTLATFTETLYDAEGAANKMRLTMEDNLIGDFYKLKSAVTEMGLQLGKQTDGPMRDFIQWMTEVINGSEDTLGVVDSLARTFLFLEESILLAFKAAEEFWQFQQRNNPVGWVDQLFGGDGMLQGSVDRLNLIKARLAEINGEIIKISDYGGVKSSSGGSGSSGSSGGGNKGGGGNSIGAGSGIGSDFGFGFASFFEPQELDEIATTVEGFTTRIESAFTKMTENVTGDGMKMKEEIDLAAVGVQAAISGIISAANAGKGNELEAFASGIISTLQQIAIASAITAASKDSVKFGAVALPILIAAALGIVKNSFSSNGISGGGAGGGGGSAAPSTASVTPSSSQGVGTGGQLVATVRGQDLRFVLQGANDNYTALN